MRLIIDRTQPAMTRQRPNRKHAIDAIVDLIMRYPGEITVLAQARR